MENLVASIFHRSAVNTPAQSAYIAASKQGVERAS